jgi:hypothetical protein
MKTCKIAIKTNDHPRGTLAQAHPLGPGYEHTAMTETHGTTPGETCGTCAEWEPFACNRCTLGGQFYADFQACGVWHMCGTPRPRSDYQASMMKQEDLDRAATGRKVIAAERTGRKSATNYGKPKH